MGNGQWRWGRGARITNLHDVWLLTNDVTLSGYLTPLTISLLICKIMIITPMIIQSSNIENSRLIVFT